MERLVRDVLLLDGSTLRLCAAEPADYDDIKAFYDGLSPESRYLRFHGFANTEFAARAYAEASGVDRVALIGRHTGRVVAAASYDGLREPGVAEVAFAVAEDFRGRGTATRMLEQLADVAAQRCISRFDAWVLAGNMPMLRVFERAGFAIRRKGLGGEFTVSLDITPSDDTLRRIDERDHIGAVASLRPILAPASIAVAGVSSASGDVGSFVLERILGRFQGAVVAIDPSGEADSSAPVKPSLSELGQPPELVIVAAAPEEVNSIAASAAADGAKALLVLTSEGHDDPGAVQARRDELLGIVRAAGLRLVGPRSLGVLNTDPAVGLDATVRDGDVRPGRLAICSQSGAIGVGLLGQAAARGIGVSSFVSLGDRIDVSTNDVLELWEEDGQTAAVMLYVETFGNPEHFGRIARRVSRRKPILAVKGRRAAESGLPDPRSHTAAALRGDALVDALFRAAGVLRFRSGEELFNAAQFFESQPLPHGRRIAVVTNSDGIATLAVDACATRGLVVEPPSTELPNPNVLGRAAGPEAYATALAAALEDPGVDAAVAHYVDRRGDEPDAVLAAIERASSDQPKPVVASVVRSDGTRPRGDAVPNFLFPEECAGVLAHAADRREWLSRPLGERPSYTDLDADGARATIASNLADAVAGGGWLAAVDAQKLLGTHGIGVIASEHCASVEAAISAAGEIGAPIALKADFPPPADAAEVDAVLLGLHGEVAVRAGWHELERRVRMSGRAWTGTIVQPLAQPGADVLVGTLSDPDLGPVMAVGPGGRQAGLGATAAFGPLPATDVEADELIAASSGVVRQLEGFRGGAELDRAALRELLLRFAMLLTECPEVVEADLNPVRCLPRGCLVLDLRMRLEDRADRTRVKTW